MYNIHQTYSNVLFTFYCSRKRRNPNLCYNGPRRGINQYYIGRYINVVRRSCRDVWLCRRQKHCAHMSFVASSRTGYLISYNVITYTCVHIYIGTCPAMVHIIIIFFQPSDRYLHQRDGSPDDRTTWRQLRIYPKHVAINHVVAAGTVRLYNIPNRSFMVDKRDQLRPL